MILIGVWAAAEGIRFTVSETFRGFHDIRLASLLGDPLRSVLLAVGFVVLKLTVDSTSLRTAVIVSLGASVVTCIARGRVPLEQDRARCGRGRAASRRRWCSPIAIPLTLTDLTGMIVAQGDVWVVGAFRSARRRRCLRRGEPARDHDVAARCS